MAVIYNQKSSIAESPINQNRYLSLNITDLEDKAELRSVLRLSADKSTSIQEYIIREAPLTIYVKSIFINNS